MPTYRLEPMSDSRLQEAASVYNYYIRQTTVTFHINEITTQDMKDILYSGDPRFPAYAIMEGDEFCGYCLLAVFKKREAYNGTAEITIYLKPGCERRGIGSRATAELEEIALSHGFHTLLAVISGENTASIGLFTRMGYEKCAHLKEVGMKFGRKLDIVYYQKLLQQDIAYTEKG